MVRQHGRWNRLWQSEAIACHCWKTVVVGLLFNILIGAAIAIAPTIYPEPVYAREEASSQQSLSASQAQVLAAIARYNPQLDRATAREIASWIVHYSDTHGIHLGIITGLVARESSFNPRATSRTGAQGLGQIKPILAGDLGIRNAYDIRQNIEGTTRWLRRLYDVWSSAGIEGADATTWALASYRQGLTRTRQVGIPPATADYINDIYAIARQISQP